MTAILVHFVSRTGYRGAVSSRGRPHYLLHDSIHSSFDVMLVMDFFLSDRGTIAQKIVVCVALCSSDVHQQLNLVPCTFSIAFWPMWGDTTGIAGLQA